MRCPLEAITARSGLRADNDNENGLRRFFGFPPKCTSVSAFVFVFKPRKNRFETEHFSVGFSVNPSNQALVKRQ